MKALLLALLIGCGQQGLCESPCPNATKDWPGADGMWCWCGDSMPLLEKQPFRWNAPDCDADRAAWFAAVPDGGCPQQGGGHGK